MNYVNYEKPPVCLHVLGQPLVNALWEEAQELKEMLLTMAKDRKAVTDQNYELIQKLAEVESERDKYKQDAEELYRNQQP